MKGYMYIYITILLKYRSKNNYVEAFKKLYRMFYLVARMSKLFAATLSCLGVLYHYFDGPA
jgi:hypothetical protein